MKADFVILGIAGELGSHLAKLGINMGYSVKGFDIVRPHEAWRLHEMGIFNKVRYTWKSVHDISKRDIRGATLLFDAACVADRQLGNNSPLFTLFENLVIPLRVLETVRNLDDPPICIYPSSANVYLGVPKEEQPLIESTKPAPTGFYGWSKLAAEEMYLTYYRTYNTSSIVVRTGSCFYPMMRTAQLIGNCCIHFLSGKDFVLNAAEPTRTYTYGADVMDFYKLLFTALAKDKDKFVGRVLHNGGNKEDRPYSNLEIAQMIKVLTESDNKIIISDPEIGEVVKGEYVYQWERSPLAKELLGWSPCWTVEDGLKETIAWFKDSGLIQRRVMDFSII